MDEQVKEMVKRLQESVKRITSGGAPMRIPVDQTDADIVMSEAASLLESLASQLEASRKDARQKQEIIDYIDAFYVSGNSIPIHKPWISHDSWTMAKELLSYDLPLDHDLIERELVYRRKLVTYGDETRAKSPLRERLAALAGREHD